VQRQWLRSGEYGATKTAAGTRVIPLSDDVVKELVGLRLASSYSDDRHPIFASLHGTPLQHRNVTSRGWEEAREEAGVEGVTFHDLRHAAASRLIEAGLSPVRVAAVLGHENANITLGIYAHLFDAQKRADEVRAAL
jgi:integrase